MYSIFAKHYEKQYHEHCPFNESINTVTCSHSKILIREVAVRNVPKCIISLNPINENETNSLYYNQSHYNDYVMNENEPINTIIEINILNS